jgi:hypothetical protein
VKFSWVLSKKQSLVLFTHERNIKMLLKKILLSQICEDTGFTEDSYVVIDIPSVKEKMDFRSKYEGLGDSEDANVKIIVSLISKVNCTPIDGSDLITDWDTLSCYSITTPFLKFLSEVVTNGYVPKKS